jgi:uncharacterized oxidoreductase
MKVTDNTILITGGGSGIGRGLAEAFHELGNQVIISGRRTNALEETCAANPGMKWITVDMRDAANTKAFAIRVIKDHPSLNVLVNNAGIMRLEDLLRPPAALTDAEEIVTTNLLGPIRLTAALMPHLRKQARATVMTVSSGLAFVPLAYTPTYCATKAAIHSYTQSLRYQLRDTPVEVLELIPPYVATSLLTEDGPRDPRAMPLDEFIAEVMEILKTQPDATELCVERVKPLRFAAEQGREEFERFFTGFNASLVERDPRQSRG